MGPVAGESPTSLIERSHAFAAFTTFTVPARLTRRRSNSNVTCTGNPDQICGGRSRVSIFADPSALRPADNSNDDDSNDDGSNDDGGSSDPHESTAASNLASPSVVVYLLATCLSISRFVVNF